MSKQAFETSLLGRKVMVGYAQEEKRQATIVGAYIVTEKMGDRSATYTAYVVEFEDGTIQDPVYTTGLKLLPELDRLG